MGNHSLREALAECPVWNGLDGGVCIIACSGGRDSVALTYATTELLRDSSFVCRFTTPPQIALWHLDHGLRPNSTIDAEFVRNLAKKLDVPCIIEKVTLPREAGNVEATARQVRYEKLLRLLSDPLPTDNLPLPRRALTAHHLGDQVETVLHHLVRGTHLRGLRAISPMYHQLIFRPWLNQLPETLQAYLVEHGKTWREDETNRDTSLTRNLLRHLIIPQLLSINPQAREHIARLSDIARDVQTIVDNQVEQLQVETFSAVGLMPWLPILSVPRGRYFTHFRAEGWGHPTVMAEYIARQLKPRMPALCAADHETITSWALSPAEPLVLHGVRITFHQKNLITLTFPGKKLDYPVSFELQPNQPILQGRLRCEIHPATADDWSSHQISFRKPWEFIRDWSGFLLQRNYFTTHAAEWNCYIPCAMKLPLAVRNWQPGDALTLPSGGTKKIGDIFTDAKVPEMFRPCWSIVVDATERIVWVPGLADSADIQIARGQAPAWRLQLNAMG